MGWAGRSRTFLRVCPFHACLKILPLPTYRENSISNTSNNPSSTGIYIFKCRSRRTKRCRTSSNLKFKIALLHNLATSSVPNASSFALNSILNRIQRLRTLLYGLEATCHRFCCFFPKSGSLHAHIICNGLQHLLTVLERFI